MKENLLLFLQNEWQNHRGRSAGLLIGTIFALSILLFGFWKTLFVIFCAGIGMYIGLRIERASSWTELVDTTPLNRLFRRIS